MNANHQLFGNRILIKNFSDFQVSSIKKQNTQIYNKNNNTWIECTTFRKYVYVNICEIYMRIYIWLYEWKNKKMLYITIIFY